MIMRRLQPVSTLSVTVSLLAMSSGCAIVGANRNAGGGSTAQTPTGGIPPSFAQPTTEAGSDAELAALVEFLERTAKYDEARLESPRENRPHPGAAQKIQPAASFDLASRSAPPTKTPAPRVADASDFVSANAQMALDERLTRQPMPALPVVESLSIPAADLDDAVSEEAPNNATNESMDLNSASATGIVAPFLSYLKTRAEASRMFDHEWQHRLALLALHRDREALEISSEIPREAQDLLGTLIRAVIGVRSATRDPLSTGNEALARVEELRDLLAGRADPVVATLALCRKVVTFGAYEPLPDTDFVAGRSTQAIVYIEIRNFQSERTDEGHHRTALATRLEVLTGGGQSVWRHEEPEVVDVCRRRRTDFFIAQRIVLPPSLPAGDYVLKVLVDDRLTGRADEASHSFRILSATSLAGAP